MLFCSQLFCSQVFLSTIKRGTGHEVTMCAAERCQNHILSAEKLVLHAYCHQLLFSWPTYQMSLFASHEWNPSALSTHEQATSSCSAWQFPQASTPNVRLHIIHWFLLRRTQQTIPASSNKDLGGAFQGQDPCLGRVPTSCRKKKA